MQGFIIDTKIVNNEDLIVEILTRQKIIRAYRFYGMRHSIINVGFKIDFELEQTQKSNLARLKDVMQLNFVWIFDNQKMFNWQKFIKLFHLHFKDVNEIETFYFDLLEECVIKISKQNERRVLVETYVKLLQAEGRLHADMKCFLCDEDILEDVAPVRAFLPSHKSCSYSPTINIEKMKIFFDTKSTIFLNDDEVDLLWKILLQGI